MPQVPYNPVPQVGPSGQGIPNLNPAAPPDAFGASIGAALSHVGRIAESTGDEVFKRALAIQHLDNEATAREADTRFILETGNVRADYQSKKGKDAAESYPKFSEDVELLRTEIRKSLPNADSQKMYDSQTQGAAARLVFSGAGHAANQQKEYLVGTAKAKITALGDQAFSAPKDGPSFDAALKGLPKLVQDQADVMGWGPEQTEEQLSKDISGLWAQRIVGLAKSDPYKASDLLDHALENKWLRGEQVTKVTDIVRQQMRQTGARMVSHDINNPESVAGVPAQYLEQMKKFEGFRDKPYWDHKQWSSGYGTKARGPDERVSKEEHDARFRAAVDDAATTVDQLNPNLSVGTRAALISLTYNAGASWTEGKLGALIAAGKEQEAKQVFLAYNQASGKPHEGLIRRRAQEVGWFGKDKPPEEPLSSKVERGEKLAAEQAPNDPLYPDFVRDRIIVDDQKKKQIRRDDEWHDTQTVQGALNNGVNGKVPTTLDDLLADPDADAAYQRLPETKRKQVRAALLTNAKEDFPQSQEAFQQYQNLRGKFASYNEMSVEEREEYLNTNVMAMKLPRQWRGVILDQQRKAKANVDTDPRVSKAMIILGPQLQAAGYMPGQDKDGYYEFKGLLSDAIEDHTKTEGVPPKAKDIQLIGSRLLQKISSPWWGDVWRTPMFQYPVPDKEAEIIKNDPYWKERGITPDDAQVTRIYRAKLYMKLYSKAKELGAAKKEEGPQPPMSQ